MNIDGDIILIEDDPDDREIMMEVFGEVISENNYQNKVVFIDDSSKAVPYLQAAMSSPFMIISDINMPKIDGYELRERIFKDTTLNQRCIPYLFLTTSGGNNEQIKKAFDMSVQGYFLKPDKYADYKTMVSNILGYWKVSRKP